MSRIKSLIKKYFLQSIDCLLRFYFNSAKYLFPVPKKRKFHFHYFDFRDFQRLKRYVFELRGYDSYLRTYLSKKHAGGIKAWEYASLLNLEDNFKDKKIIDIGCGKSTFGDYLQDKGGELYYLDLPDQMDYSPFIPYQKKAQREYIYSTVLKMPFEDETFDLVLSISAIEHLHQKMENPRLTIAYPDFLKTTQVALREMARILKKGGHLYLTTDVYFSDLQTSDNWWSGDQPEDVPFVGAYKITDFEDTFVKTLKSENMVFKEPVKIDFSALKEDRNRAAYRGRFFTTFYLWMEKT